MSLGRRVRQCTGWLLATVVLLASSGCQPASGGGTVVVYTSLDQPFSEPILLEFEKQYGISVQTVYDVEAAKTTGLVNRLVAEKSRPRADVFWSSEYAQTLLLQDRGVLAPYLSPQASDIPRLFRDPEGYWTGFAARARVILANRELVPREQYPSSIFDLTEASWGEGDVGVANPLFGTTATHAAALFAALGPQPAQGFFQKLRDRGARIVDGNSVVRDMVVSGELKVGLTDTDDAYVAIVRGDPVEMLFPDQEGLGTLVIPNTVALVEGAPNPAEGKRLIDYLLSAEVESMLARAESRQIPVRPGVVASPDMPSLQELRAMAVHPRDVAAQMEASSTWLKEVFLR